jgi:hypothetical protein
MQSGVYQQMRGYSKIKGCCRQAVLDGFQWAWIDFCCFDKSSSSEISEAINSMFHWYRNAKVCYAYLSDVSSAAGIHSEEGSGFRRSPWFTRGWTLQELLAPGHVTFYGVDWVEIGTRSSLDIVISRITGIESLLEWENACVV